MTSRTLGLALLLGGIAATLAGGLLGSRLLAQPEAALQPLPNPEAGWRFQQGVAQLLLRQGGLSQRDDPVVLTAPETSAFLSRHVETRLGLRPVMVRVEDGWIEVAGRTSLRHLLSRTSVGWVVRLTPDVLVDVDVWLGARGSLQIRDGQGEFRVHRVAVGRQAVSRDWLWDLLGVNPAELLIWRMPRIVERVDLEPGRLVIHTRR